MATEPTTLLATDAMKIGWRRISASGRGASSSFCEGGGRSGLDIAIEGKKQQGGGKAEDRHHQIGAGEQRGRKQVLAPGRERGAEHGGDDAARQHGRDRPALACRLDGIGGCQAVILREGLEYADAGRADAEGPEAPGEHGPHRDAPAQGADQAAEREAELAADALHQEGGEQRGESARDRDHREGQGREQLVGRELVAGEAGEREIDRDRASEKALADREDQRVAAPDATLMVGLGVCGGYELLHGTAFRFERLAAYAAREMA